MADPGWRDLDAALERAASRRPVRFWLRDDDAVDATPALSRLAGLCAAAGLPVLLAVIPAGATARLADWLGRHAAITPCQHGVAHANHAGAGQRACELGGNRPDEVILDELARGRERLRACFGSAMLSDILVPPWNRMRDSLIPSLAPLGFSALSRFAGAGEESGAPLARLDCDLDIIDWRNGRRGRTEGDLCARLVRLLDDAAEAGRPVGLLTHHLAHDEAAWRFLDRFLRFTRGDPRVSFSSAAEELARAALGNAAAH